MKTAIAHFFLGKLISKGNTYPVVKETDLIVEDNFGHHVGYSKERFQIVQQYENTLEEIFDREARNTMKQWDLDEFKKTFPRLFKTIIASMKEAQNQDNL